MKLLEEVINNLPERLSILLNEYEDYDEPIKIIENAIKEEIKLIDNKEQKINFLEDILISAKGFYYEDGIWLQEKYNIHTLITDKFYDELELEYKNLSGKEMEVGIKTNIINGKFPKHKHTRLPGVSQHKTTKQIDVLEHLKNKNMTNKELVFSEKLDGSSLYLIYDKEGNLIKGVTRGDGTYGNDITLNVLNMKGVLKKIDTSIYPDNINFIEIRGESNLLKEDLKKVNEVLLEKNEKIYKNTRNAVPGILMSPYSNASSFLTFKAYQEILEDNENNIIENDQSVKFENLKKLGFDTPYYKLINNIDELFKEYEEYILRKRKSLPYDIDGLVIVLNNSEERIKLGYTNNKDNGSFALKFPADAVMSKVKKIHFQLGDSSGNVTPVVEIEPVDIEGATITKISLANENLFDSTALCVNDHVYIRRSGDVIPQIIKNEKFDIYYKHFENLIKKSFSNLENLYKDNKNILNTVSNLNNKYFDSYSETIPLRFELMTNLNKLLLDIRKNEEKEILLTFITRLTNEIVISDFKKELNKEIFSNDKKENKKIKEEIYNNITEILIKETIIYNNKYVDQFLNNNNNNISLYIKEEEKNFNKLYDNLIEFTKTCPVCGSELSSNGIISKCINDNCKGRKIGQIVTFIEKSGVKGFKKSSIEFLFENNLIQSIEDLFKLNKKDFVISIDDKQQEVYFKGWGERKIDKTLETINELRELDGHIFLGSLGIQNYGRTSFEKLLENFSFEKIINNEISKEEYINIEGFMNVDDLIEELDKKKEMISNLLKYIKIKEKEEIIIDKDAIKIYFTGSPKGIIINNIEINKKEELFKELNKMFNGKIIQSEKFSKKDCDLLVYGGDATTKIQKANKMGINSLEINDLIKNGLPNETKNKEKDKDKKDIYFKDI